jgi:hypothetical protein
VSAPPKSKSRTSQDARTAFAVIAALGIAAAAIVWFWYGFVQLEAQTEQGKALAAGTTMAGFADMVGGIPLVLAHLVGLAVLLVLGWKGYGARGIAFAILAVVIASGLGVLCAQLLWEGQLFELGINNDTYIP